MPNEFIESYFPLRIERYETIPDSGGAGLHRGGNGLSVAYRFLADGDIAIHDERWLTYPWGVLGGQVGMRSTKRLVRTDGSEEWLPSKCDGIKVNVGDLLYFNTWGGGGWGDPLERDAALVLADVKRNLATAEGAKDYGVVIEVDGAVDEAATQALAKRCVRNAAKSRPSTSARRSKRSRQLQGGNRTECPGTTGVPVAARTVASTATSRRDGVISR